jgi:hypothetical protein
VTVHDVPPIPPDDPPAGWHVAPDPDPITNMNKYIYPSNVFREMARQMAEGETYWNLICPTLSEQKLNPTVKLEIEIRYLTPHRPEGLTINCVWWPFCRTDLRILFLLLLAESVRGHRIPNPHFRPSFGSKRMNRPFSVQQPPTHG